MVVIKLVVKEPSEKRKRRQLLPTPAKMSNKNEQKQRTSLGNIQCEPKQQLNRNNTVHRQNRDVQIHMV